MARRPKKTDLFLAPFERRQRIEMIMRQRGLTQYAMAKALRRTQTSFRTTLESQNPQVNTIKDIAYILGTSASFLVDRETMREEEAVRVLKKAGYQVKKWRER